MRRVRRRGVHTTYTYLSTYLYLFLAFGLGTMIYNGLEFGAFFEVPFTSPCYMILRGVNPVLQMVFTFMQMYFIFMNSRVSIKKTYQVINNAALSTILVKLPLPIIRQTDIDRFKLFYVQFVPAVFVYS